MDQLRLASCRVDLGTRTVDRGGRTDRLTTKEAELLGYLAANADRAVSREELLEEVWGYARTAVTRAVDFTVRRLRKKVEAEPSAPQHVLTVHGVGYQFCPVSADPGPGPAAAEVLSVASALAGRDRELAELSAMVSEGARLVTLVGGPGVGKTRLAKAFAKASGLPRLDVHLAEAADLDDVVRTVVDTTGLPIAARDVASAVRQLEEALAVMGPLVVLLDACPVTDAVGAAIGRWLTMAPEVVLLVTAAHSLRVSGEHLLEVGPLAPADAAWLLRSLVPDDLDEALVARLVHRVGGAPAAIELAAGQLVGRTLDEVVASFDALPSADGALDPSWSLLEPWEQQAVVRGAVFRGGFDLEAAEALLDQIPGGPPPLDLLESLQDRSLVRAWEPDRGPDALRFALSPGIEASARAALAAHPDRDALRAAHLDHYLDRLWPRVEGMSEPDAETHWLATIERDNLLAAAEHTSDPLRAARAILAACSPRYPSGSSQRWLAALRDLLTEELDRPMRARIYLRRGALHRIRGERDAAQADLMAAFQLAVGAGDTGVQAAALLELALGFVEDGDLARAAETVQQASGRVADRPDKLAELMCLAAEIHRLSGDLTGADEVLAEAGAVAREAGVRRAVGRVSLELAMVARHGGRLTEAETHLDAAAAQLEPDSAEAGMVDVERAWLALERGDLSKARAHASSARTVLAVAPWGPWEADARLVDAVARWRGGDGAAADEALRALERAALDAGDRLRAARVTAWRARFAGRPAELQGADERVAG